MKMFSHFSRDPIAVLLGSDFHSFETPHGVEGLARVVGDRLDVLAIFVREPGTGKFRRFIADAKEEFRTVAFWHDWNPILGAILERYGFKRAAEAIEGEGTRPVRGWKWECE